MISPPRITAKSQVSNITTEESWALKNNLTAWSRIIGVEIVNTAIPPDCENRRENDNIKTKSSTKQVSAYAALPEVADNNQWGALFTQENEFNLKNVMKSGTSCVHKLSIILFDLPFLP